MYTELLGLHESLVLTSRQMLELARQGHARKFNMLREHFLEQIEEMRSKRPAIRLSAAQREELAPLVLELIRIDGRIRRHVDPQMARIEQWLAPERRAPGADE